MKKETQMSELHSIPLTCKEGVYSVFDFYQDADGEDAIFFDYDTQYQMLTYGPLLLMQNRHQKMPAWDLGSGWLNNWLCGKNMKIKSLW